MHPYIHFTLEERQCLYQRIREGWSISEIARELGRNKSSVSREVARNKNKDGSYHWWRGQNLYTIRRKRSIRKPRIRVNSALYNFIVECLMKYWSPELIVVKWKETHTDSISHSTIYRAIRQAMFKNISPKTHLRRREKRRKTGNSASVKPEHLIADRPDMITNRERIGDWEGDTVYGGVNKGYLVTLVDRKSRLLVARLITQKTAREVNMEIIKGLSGMNVLTISFDNGSEFAEYKELEAALKSTTYFAHPHSPWERGSNENINDVLRFFYPKGTDFTKVTDEELQLVVALINDRPRKCLGYLSPASVYLNSCCT